MYYTRRERIQAETETRCDDIWEKREPNRKRLIQYIITIKGNLPCGRQIKQRSFGRIRSGVHVYVVNIIPNPSTQFKKFDHPQKWTIVILAQTTLGTWKGGFLGTCWWSVSPDALFIFFLGFALDFSLVGLILCNLAKRIVLAHGQNCQSALESSAESRLDSRFCGQTKKSIPTCIFSRVSKCAVEGCRISSMKIDEINTIRN